MKEIIFILEQDRIAMHSNLRDHEYYENTFMSGDKYKKYNIRNIISTIENMKYEIGNLENVFVSIVYSDAMGIDCIQSILSILNPCRKIELFNSNRLCSEISSMKEERNKLNREILKLEMYQKMIESKVKFNNVNTKPINQKKYTDVNSKAKKMIEFLNYDDNIDNNMFDSEYYLLPSFLKR